MSVDFLRILDVVGVEARMTQYDKSESSHFFIYGKTYKAVRVGVTETHYVNTTRKSSKAPEVWRLLCFSQKWRKLSTHH